MIRSPWRRARDLLVASRTWARGVKRDVLTLWFVRSHPDTPWTARLLAALVVAYAFSPIDLIPDFIPVLGWLDDVILLPALIWLTVRLLPPHVRAHGRAQAEAWLARREARPRSPIAAVVIVALWLLVAGLLAHAWLSTP
ncbi:YkvA family protein [Leptothrix discophora]|uniref:YkvA family protein n=1 Tax=Leptothrix discophora TaxID=89 RepID=A0ABT9G3P0_LEPDI|nr:YkvA family protein [Leptothrix discophora]MDP4301102.1 YkvA family protein [Leptothrix discophora]